MDLKAYEQYKFSLAEILRSVNANRGQDETITHSVRELLARLADDRFQLMVVGRFSRGKSTLMNAVLGSDHLPTGIVPLTSVITTVRYGSHERALIHFRGSGLPTDIPLSRLAEYVTQRENPGNIKQVEVAEIQLPAELLRRGLFFVDTPGLGSVIRENTETTERFLPEADAFILVTSYDSPITEDEARILAFIGGTGKHLYIAVNKQDTVLEKERGDVLSFIREQALHLTGLPHIPVFSISARDGLAAKLSNNEELLNASGLPTLEGELFRFLLEDRAQAFLSSMCQRVLQFLNQATSPELASMLDVQADKVRNLSAEINSVSKVRQDSQRFQDQSKLQFDNRTGCVICGEILHALLDFLRHYQYTLSVNPATQQKHADRHGFCSLHTWHYEALASPQGICTAYPALLYQIANTLKELASANLDGASCSRKLSQVLPSSASCPACEVRTQSERKALASIIAKLPDAVEQGQMVPVLCLSHLVAVVAGTKDQKAATYLLEEHSRLMVRIAEDMQRYALRHEALRRYLSNDEERQAPLRALLLLAGHKNVAAPWSVEYLV